MTHTLDKVLADHSAPVLLGKKPGALFSISVSPKKLAPYDRELRARGVRIMQMSCRRGRSQMLVYRPKMLQRALATPEARAILDRFGYPDDGCLGKVLGHLMIRMRHDDFPHEIGLFLGYPPEDVVGFVENKGRDYKLCGPWKVYGDTRTARMTFALHEECRRRLVQFVERGGSVCHMCSAEAV